MALTQRLEFRQSQSLVMTPQLMQAIKLLQLSNLDLSAFVEEELERNPLLERASDGPETPVAGEPAQETAHERGEFSASDDQGGFGENGGGGTPRCPRGSVWPHHVGPGAGERVKPELGPPAPIEQTLDTPPHHSLSPRPAGAAAPR